MRDFFARLQVTSATRILDVGGTPGTWTLTDVRPRVTLLNMPRARETGFEEFTSVFADACRLPFRDQSFEIVFSNSVIEHVGERDRQREFASEIRRVGRRYWVQTPNRWFPIEQHLLTPFIHWMPRRVQAAWAKSWTVWDWFERRPKIERDFYIGHYLDQVRLLSAAELAELFPGAEILRERRFGWTKSLMAIRQD